MANAVSINDERHATSLIVALEFYPQMAIKMIHKFPPNLILTMIQNDPKNKFMKKLIPTLSTDGFNKLDISLLYRLIRHFNLLPEPSKEWGNIPLDTDINQGDDMERMRLNRNDLVHRPRGGLSKEEGDKFFKESIEIAIRLDNFIGDPTSSFETGIRNVTLHHITQDKYIEALEKCAKLQQQLKDISLINRVDLYYGDDIAVKLGDQDLPATDYTRCTIYIRNPNMDVPAIIEQLKQTIEILNEGAYDVILLDAKSGSLVLDVEINNLCFKTKNSLHKAIAEFLRRVFTSISGSLDQHSMEVVLAECDSYIISDNEEENDEYLNDQEPSILKLDVMVRNTSLQSKTDLYPDVHGFISKVLDVTDKDVESTNGSPLAVIMTSQHVDDSSPSGTPEKKKLVDYKIDPDQLKLIKEDEGNKILWNEAKEFTKEGAQAVEELNVVDIHGKTLFTGRAQKKAEGQAEWKDKSERINRVNLFVKNLDDNIDDERLRKEFSQFGTITSAKVDGLAIKEEEQEGAASTALLDDNASSFKQARVKQEDERMAEATTFRHESNYIKIAMLVLKISPRAVRVQFDKEFHPVHLQRTLNRNFSLLSNLKRKNRVTQPQWNLLFPRTGEQPSSKDFDMTLMICLLRNLIPIDIMDRLPSTTDTSLRADLYRIKYYRNIIANCNSTVLDDDTVFESYWNDVTPAILRLGGNSLKAECDFWYGRNLDAEQKVLVEANKKLIELEQEQSTELAEMKKKLKELEQEQSTELAEMKKKLTELEQEQSTELAEMKKKLIELEQEQSTELAEMKKKLIELEQEQRNPVPKNIRANNINADTINMGGDETNITMKNTDKKEQTDTSEGSSSSSSSENETPENFDKMEKGRHNSDCGQETGDVDINKKKRSKMKPVSVTEQNNISNIEKIAAKHGFSVKNVRVDGNCMFHAIALQLLDNKLKSKIGEEKSKELRCKIVEFLKNNGTTPTGEKYSSFLSSVHENERESRWSTYLASMSKPGTYGDEIILRAVSHCFNVHIHVLSTASPERFIKYNSPDISEDSSTVYLGFIDEYLHYVRLQPESSGNQRPYTSMNESSV